MAKAKKPVVEVNQELAFIKEKPKTRQDLLKFYKQMHLKLKGNRRKVEIGIAKEL